MQLCGNNGGIDTAVLPEDCLSLVQLLQHQHLISLQMQGLTAGTQAELGPSSVLVGNEMKWLLLLNIQHLHSRQETSS